MSSEDMTFDKATAWMLVGHLNQHFPHPEDYTPDLDDPLGDACCVIGCGPCSALHWIAQDQDGRTRLEEMLKQTGFQEGGWCYWDDTADGLRWDWFAYYWSQHKACGISNGVLLPCDGSDEEEDHGEFVEEADQV